MKKILMAGAAAAAIMMTGCGGGSSSADGADYEEGLSEGLTFVMFDNVTSEQYSYETAHAEVEDLNIEGENYDMTGKNGKLVVWTQHMVDDEGNETEEQKVVMLNEIYDITIDGNVTYEDFHYLGHFHTNEETNESEFAAHSADEFDLSEETNETIIAKKQAALDSLSAHLLEREEIRGELEEALFNVNATGDLCNFIVVGEHEEHDDNVTDEEHGAPHIALTTDGYVYVFEENATTHELVQDGVHFLLGGVTNCTETMSDIMQVGEHGVAIFSAQTQKLYMVDKHEEGESTTYGTDFHVHNTVEISEIMPAGFTPTSVVAIGEGEHDHDH
jgi:hypothetical protein